MRLLYYICVLAMGAGALCLIIFMLGHAGLLGMTYLVTATVLTAVGLVLFWRQSKTGKAFTSQYSMKIWHLLLALFVLIMLPIVLLPPTGRDELIVHLAVPKLYLEKGMIFEIPFMGFSYLPMNTDILYLLPMAIGNDTAPKLIHFCFALLTGLLIYSYFVEKVEIKYAVLGLFLFLTTPIVLQLSTTAYIDLSLTFYAALALMTLLKWKEKFNHKWLILSALATGLAIGSKISALIFLLLFTFTIVWSYSRATKNQSKAMQMGLLYLFIAMLVFSPWLIRNYLWTRNPIYPYANSLFAVNSALEQGVHLSPMPPLMMRKALYGEDLWYALLIPFRIFWEGRDGSHQYFDGILNPFFLFFIPFAFVGVRNRDANYFALVAVFFMFIAFFTIDIVMRYLLPILPILVILAVYGIKKAFEIKRLKYLMVIALAGMFIYNGWYLVNLYKRYQPAAYFTGMETKDQYLSRMLPDYPAIAFANATLPRDARVMLLFAGDRGYYWERKYNYGDRGGGDIIQFVNGSLNEKDLKDKFRAMGVTHLYIKDSIFNKFANNNFEEKQRAMLVRFFQSCLITLYGENGFTLYEIVGT